VIECCNKQQLLKLNKGKEKGKRIFANSRKPVAFARQMAYFFTVGANTN